MIESTLTKRRARHIGEVGLFPDNVMAGEDLAPISDGTQVLAKYGSPKNLVLNNYMWALATIVADAVDGLHDKDDALEFLCVKARFMKTVLDPKTGKLEIRRKSTRRLSNEAFHRLLDRLVHVTITELIPNMDEGDLRREIERMVGIEAPLEKMKAARIRELKG